MRRIVLIVPEWLDLPGEESALRKGGAAFEQLAGQSRVFKIPALEPGASEELAYFGIDSFMELPQGPLTVAAFGADPPARSVHFHLSLASLAGDQVVRPEFELPGPDLDIILGHLKRLNSRSFTLVEGEGLNHGLVWEDGSVDLGTTPLGATPISFAGDRPEGDGEPLLRRYIDDSVNLLHELELNIRRVDEGLPPINVAWPWGQGFRDPLPNLPLMRGEPATVLSGSLRVQGLTRLMNYRHGERSPFGKGVNVRLEAIGKAASTEKLLLIVLLNIAALRRREMLEEVAWLTHQIGERLLTSLINPPSEDPVRLTVLAPGAAGGLGLEYRSNARMEGLAPFDERALEERGLETVSLWKAADRGLAP